VALGHYKACRAGQWPPPDHHPAGGAQPVPYPVLAVDVAFPAAHEPPQAIRAAKTGWVWVGLVQKSTSSGRAQVGALACTGSGRSRLCSGVKTWTTLASKNAS